LMDDGIETARILNTDFNVFANTSTAQSLPVYRKPICSPEEQKLFYGRHEKENTR
jgi:hypothetical protein